MVFKKSSQRKETFLALRDQAANLAQGAELLTEFVGLDRVTREPLMPQLCNLDRESKKTTRQVMEFATSGGLLNTTPATIFYVSEAIQSCTTGITGVAQAMSSHNVGLLPTEAYKLVDLIAQSSELTKNLVFDLETGEGDVPQFWLATGHIVEEAMLCYRNVMTDLLNDGSDTTDHLKVTEVLHMLIQTVQLFKVLASKALGLALR